MTRCPAPEHRHVSRRKLLMYTHRKSALATVLLAAAAVVIGCEHGSSTGSGTSSQGPSRGGCPASLARADAAVRQDEKANVAWNGPTSGPKAVSGKTIVYVAQTMTNPGVAGVAKGVRQAAGVIGWKLRVIDGGGTPVGIQAAMSQAVSLKPSGIVIGGFDPG